MEYNHNFIVKAQLQSNPHWYRSHLNSDAFECKPTENAHSHGEKTMPLGSANCPATLDGPRYACSLESSVRQEQRARSRRRPLATVRVHYAIDFRDGH